MTRCSIEATKTRLRKLQNAQNESDPVVRQIAQEQTKSSKSDFYPLPKRRPFRIHIAINGPLGVRGDGDFTTGADEEFSNAMVLGKAQAF